MIRSKIAHRMYGRPEVLAPAKDLTAIKGINEAPITGGITYYHILMGTHEILFAEGAPAESLYLGTQTLHAIEPAARAELRLIFGAGWDRFIEQPQSARPFASGQKARNMAARHRKNNQPALTL